MAWVLRMVFISVVGVNQDLYQYKTAVMLAGVGMADQEFSHVSQISLQESLSDRYDRNLFTWSGRWCIQPTSPRPALHLSWPNSDLSHSPMSYVQVKLSLWRFTFVLAWTSQWQLRMSGLLPILWWQIQRYSVFLSMQIRGGFGFLYES